MSAPYYNQGNAYYTQSNHSFGPAHGGTYGAYGASSDSLNGGGKGAYGNNYENDAWGVYDSPQARDRFLARKEAAMAASDSAYDYASPSKGSSKRKWWLIGGGLILLVAIGAGVGIYMSMRNKDSNTAKATGAVKSDPNDPSKFTKDPALHQSMYGLCYTPLNAQYPQCGDTLEAVIEDVQIMSQLTTRIRTYGADCNVPELVLEAIEKTKVNMEVFLAVWVDTNATTYARQVQSVVDAITKFGVDHVAGITVGNEYLLNGGPESDLITKMADMRQTLAGLNLPKTLPVGTADAGSMVTTTLSEGADFIMANVHPWFGGVPVEQAAAWTWSYTNNNEPSSALLASNKPTLYVAESGWPTGANETRLETYQGARAGIAELNTFLETFVCESNANVTAGTGQPAFIFEAFDEPWKDALYGGVEAHWGLFTSDKKLKEGLVIPNCQAP